tara:strand:- start:173 stop:703 length:531 start_codon:yes stop_codon:yes gene_type:complete
MTGIFKINNNEVFGSDGTFSGTIGSGATIHDSLFKAGTGAFLASSDSQLWASLSDGQICPFNVVNTGSRFDTDSNYNTSTYKYEVPATGVYLFYYGIYTAENDASNYFGFETNSGEVDNENDIGNYFSAFVNHSDDHIQTATLIIPLNSGDTIWVSSRSASDFYKGHSYWGGCRLK